MVHITKTKDSILMEFFVTCKTSFGQSLYICGNCPELGNWNPLAGIKLQTNRKTYPQWYTPSPIIMKANQHIEFKICVVKDRYVIWQNIPQNHYLLAGRKPAHVYLDFNSLYLQYLEKNVIEIECRKGITDIFGDVQSQWGSSLGHLSNYPLEKYHKQTDQGYRFQESSVSSNLISCQDTEQIDFQLRIFNKFQQLNLLKTRSNHHHLFDENFYHNTQKSSHKNDMYVIVEDLQSGMKINQRISFRSVPKTSSASKVKDIFYKTTLGQKAKSKAKIHLNVRKQNNISSIDSKSTYSSRKNAYVNETLTNSQFTQTTFQLKFRDDEIVNCQQQEQIFGLEFF